MPYLILMPYFLIFIVCRSYFPIITDNILKVFTIDWPVDCKSSKVTYFNSTAKSKQASISTTEPLETSQYLRLSTGDFRDNLLQDSGGPIMPLFLFVGPCKIFHRMEIALLLYN